MKKLLLSLFTFLLSFQSYSQKLLTTGMLGDQFGTIIKYNAGDTIVEDVCMLQGNFGLQPEYDKCVEKNRKLYGTTSSGGNEWSGVIYELHV